MHIYDLFSFLIYTIHNIAIKPRHNAALQYESNFHGIDKSMNSKCI